MTPKGTGTSTAAFIGDFARAGPVFLAVLRTVPAVIRPAARLTTAAGIRLVPAAGCVGMRLVAARSAGIWLVHGSPLVVFAHLRRLNGAPGAAAAGVIPLRGDNFRIVLIKGLLVTGKPSRAD